MSVTQGGNKMKQICKHCGGSGTVGPEPEVLTVRIKGTITDGWWYNTSDIYLGAIAKVTQSNNREDCYVRHICGTWILKSSTEIIPPIPEGYRLRRKWGEDEEEISDGDKRWDGEMWGYAYIPTSHKQLSGYIYITPITPKEDTPDPSADCLDPDTLERGDLVRNISSGNSYVVIDTHPQVIAIRSIQITNPSEWKLVEMKKEEL